MNAFITFMMRKWMIISVPWIWMKTTMPTLWAIPIKTVRIIGQEMNMRLPGIRCEKVDIALHDSIGKILGML